MQELLQFLMTGEVTITGLLLFMIACLLTGRVVPYWQVSEMKEKLKAYEEKAPNLIVEVQKLIDIQQEEIEELKQRPFEMSHSLRERRVNQRTKSPREGGQTDE